MPSRPTIKSRVLQVLRDYPEARDDINTLVVHVWQLEEPSLPSDLSQRVKHLSKVETIGRECKTIQHVEGRFRPSAEVLKARQSRIGRKTTDE
jgi:hypothetical protein